MKVFEVITEHTKPGSTEIIKTVEYVTSTDNNILSVTEYFHKNCMEYQKDLISVRELLTVSRGIDPRV